MEQRTELPAVDADQDESQPAASEPGTESATTSDTPYPPAYRDYLTGLANRRLLHELLAKEIAHARRRGRILALALLDIDHFKAFNDTLGHAAGDRILQAIARRVGGNVREADTVARIGGDEFAIVLTSAQAMEDTLEAIGRLRAVLGEPLRLDGEEIRISASIGMSLFPRDGARAEDLLARAECALRQAKKLGGNNIQVFDPSLSLWQAVDLRLEQDLRRALDEHRLCVFYQPQVDLRDGRLIGMEALVRWNDPNRGLLSAGQFIPVAERAGLMPQLGTWLLSTICRQNFLWQRAGFVKVPVSVNISVQQFAAGGVAEMVENELAATGLDPAYLQIEVTETIGLENPRRMAETLASIRQLGVGVQLDDFGTGYASLSYLLRLPIDVLKIAGEFVSGLPGDRHSAEIIRATLALAKSLDLRVIAEGLEEPGQLAFLLKHGCEAAQGFLIARPLPVVAFESVLADGRIPVPTPFRPAHENALAAALQPRRLD